MRVLDKLHDALRYAFVWAETCSCHASTRDDEEQPTNLATKCPMRGRRCSELATGDLIADLRARLQGASAELAVDLSTNLTDEQRALLMSEFDSAKAALTFNLALKLTPFMAPPLVVFGIAHPSVAKAKQSLATCLRTPCSEGPLKLLKTEPVLSEARAWLSGVEEAEQLLHFDTFRAKLVFAFSAERRIEGEHAIIHHHISKARCHSVPFVSLSQQMSQLRCRLQNDGYLLSLSTHLQSARNPKKCVEVLGLSAHAACQAARSAWDPVFARWCTEQMERLRNMISAVWM